MSRTLDEIRKIAESDLEAFIHLVHPGTVLGKVHRDVIRWWARDEASSHSLILLPRDHQKSRLAAYRAAWEITKNPAIRILYVSSTSTLATKQVKFIKDILTSDIYTKYWPEMIHPEVGQREKWTETEFCVDHPIRKREAIRDSTVFAAGLTTNIVGLHCDLAILDDLVTSENAYTELGRETVKIKYSLLASIEGAEADEIAVGTRYHPQDLYKEMMGAVIEEYNEAGDLLSSQPLYDIYSRIVEDSSDRNGSGNYLWPREQRLDGAWFGFNRNVLAKKKAQYRSMSHFFAQYYNDPNDTENAPITPDLFQYFEPSRLTKYEGRWYYAGRRLNLFAAVDFAFSIKERADYTTIVVVGVDAENNIFVVDMDRFRTGRIFEYFQHILKLHNRWGFRKLRAEVVSAQEVIVKDLKENYIRPHGLLLSIDEAKPNRHEGTKSERINAALQSRYENGQIWHHPDHNLTQVLEDELMKLHPPHDDMKDSLASVMDVLVAPTLNFGSISNVRAPEVRISHNRFGGIL